MGVRVRNVLVFSCLGVALLIWASLVTSTAYGQSESAPVASSSNTAASTSADFYVATNGNDSWPGTLAQPFATVDQARRAVESLKAHVSNRTITVMLRNGVYYLPSTLSFGSQDSGFSSSNRVVYSNYPGETPVISGGRSLSGWTQNSKGWWQTKVPSGTYFSQLWVNGVRRYRARTTPRGYIYITKPYSSTNSSTQMNGFYYTTGAPNAVPSQMANLSDVELVNFEYWDVPILKIKSVDTVHHLIVTTSTLGESGFHGFVPGHRVVLNNVKEALNQPGQWYLDRPTSTLTYIPETGESLSSATVIAPRLGKILTSSNLSYVTFQGITFAHADWQVPSGGYQSGQAAETMPAAMSLTNSTDVIFEGSTVEHTGAYGIEFLGTGTAGAAPYLAQFKDGLVSDTGAGGIRVGGYAVCGGANRHTDANVPQHVYIGNNLITGGGRIEPASQEVLVGDAHNILVDHNEIYDAYSTGIGFGFNWDYGCNFAHDDVAQYNYIHDLGQGITSDMGGVYFLTGLNTGNKAVNNRVHDIDQDPTGAGYGGWGLYVDGGSSSVLFENNLVYRTTDASLHLNQSGAALPGAAPAPNTFRNNILAFGAMGMLDRHNDIKFLSLVMDHNIFYWDKASIQYGYWYCEGKPICTSYFQLDDNLYFNKTISGGQPSQPFFSTPYTGTNGGQQPAKTYMSFAAWQSRGEDKQSLFADPRFVNPTPGVDNFTLQANSPALSMGFVPFDPSQAGRLSTATIPKPYNVPAFTLQPTAMNNF